MTAIKAILANPFDINSFENKINRVLNKVTIEAQTDYQRFAGSFDSIMPKIQVIEEDDGNLVIPERNYDGQILSYVVSGTSIRYATMEPEFTPRTRRGSLNVGPRTGGVAFVSKGVPHAGIEARDTHQLLADTYGPQLVNGAVKALDYL